MVLDIFGNVFGRSKKGSSNGNVPPSPSPSQRTLPSADLPESSELEAAAGSSATFVYPTILTNEMLQKVPTSTDEASGYTYDEGSSKTWSSHKFRPFEELTSTNPMDNVPFVPTISFASANGNGHLMGSDLASCWASLDKISIYLASSASEYNFILENTVIRESN